MNPSDNEIFESFVPVYDVVPEDWNQARPFIVEQLKRITNAVNIREIGWFIDEEVLSGKAFIPGENASSTGASSQIFRQVLRKVVDFGPLPNTTTKTVPHGINFDDNFTLVDLWGAATAPPPSYQALLLPYEAVAADGISIFINQTDIVVVTQSDRTSFTRCYVTIEYMQEL